MALSDREAVELFHLHFIRMLAAGGDKLSLRVKGGCNLRYFFGSIRYSEDLDLDAVQVEQHALKTRVDTILTGRALRDTLQISEISTPKQTDTTQCWKLALSAAGRTVPLRTKIEFSRRRAEGDVAFEAVDPNVTRHYRLPPILAAHYLLPSAIRQKVLALVGRRAAQARDIFDLSVLCAKAGGDLRGYHDLSRRVADGIERVEAMTYGEYTGQVIAFLVPEQAEPYASEEAWLAMQLQVIDALQTIDAR